MYTRVSDLRPLGRGNIEALRGDSSEVHGELAAELRELSPKGVQGLLVGAGVALVADDAQHVTDFPL